MLVSVRNNKFHLHRMPPNGISIHGFDYHSLVFNLSHVCFYNWLKNYNIVVAVEKNRKDFWKNVTNLFLALLDYLRLLIVFYKRTIRII